MNVVDRKWRGFQDEIRTGAMLSERFYRVVAQNVYIVTMSRWPAIALSIIVESEEGAVGVRNNSRN